MFFFTSNIFHRTHRKTNFTSSTSKTAGVRSASFLGSPCPTSPFPTATRGRASPRKYLKPTPWSSGCRGKWSSLLPPSFWWRVFAVTSWRPGPAVLVLATRWRVSLASLNKQKLIILKKILKLFCCFMWTLFNLRIYFRTVFDRHITTLIFLYFVYIKFLRNNTINTIWNHIVLGYHAQRWSYFVKIS